MARSLPVELVAGQLVAGDRHARPLREQAQQVALALGQLDASPPCA